MAARFASAPGPSFGGRRSGGQPMPPPANASPMFRQTGFVIDTPPTPPLPVRSSDGTPNASSHFIDPSVTYASAPSRPPYGGAAMAGVDEALTGLLDDQQLAQLRGGQREATSGTASFALSGGGDVRVSGWSSATDVNSAAVPRFFNPSHLTHRHHYEPPLNVTSPAASVGTDSYAPSDIGTSYGTSSIATPAEDSQAVFASPNIARSVSGSRLGQLNLGPAGSGGSGKASPLSRSAYGHARRVSSGTGSALSQSPSGPSPFGVQIKTEPVSLTVPASPADAWASSAETHATASYPYSVPAPSYHQRTPIAAPPVWHAGSPYAHWTPPTVHQAAIPARRSSGASSGQLGSGQLGSALPSSAPATSATFGPTGSSRSKLANVTEQSENKANVTDKRRKRRESHNLVERRRRDNINNQIAELAALLPEVLLEPTATSHHHAPAATVIREREAAQAQAFSGNGDVLVNGADPSSPPVGTPQSGFGSLLGSPPISGFAVTSSGPVLRPNKGAVLKASVDYIKYLQQLCTVREDKIRALEGLCHDSGLTQQLVNLDSQQSALTDPVFNDDYLTAIRSRHPSEDDAEGELEDDRMED